MSKNDITGDRLVTKVSSPAFRNNYDAIFKKPPFKCVFCGAPSWIDPSDQLPPPDYCHESDHGDPSLYQGENK